jgi:hypothetical protein
MNDAPLIAAGLLGLLGAGIHGIAGEVLVVRRLTAADLPPSRFGGSRMTRAMIHVSWHLTTLAFVMAAAALILGATLADPDGARALAILGAAAVTGFAVIILVLGGTGVGSPRGMLLHPAPVLVTLTAILAWWGAA